MRGHILKVAHLDKEPFMIVHSARSLCGQSGSALIREKDGLFLGLMFKNTSIALKDRKNKTLERLSFAVCSPFIMDRLFEDGGRALQEFEDERAKKLNEMVTTERVPPAAFEQQLRAKL